MCVHFSLKLFVDIHIATPSNVSGTVWYANRNETIDELLNNGPKYSPYIVILEPELFTR